MMILRMLH